jgi:hypothetical protein
MRRDGESDRVVVRVRGRGCALCENVRVGGDGSHM